MALRIKRGTTTQRLATTPVDGELVFDTTENKIYVGKNNTAGGVPVVSGVIGGLVSTNIDLNGRDITGAGNINIFGTITASGTITGNGDLVLGNAATDNVQFGADINSNIVPNTGSLTLGTTGQPWQKLYAGAIENTGGISINSALLLTSDTTAGNIVPATTSSKNLGSVAVKWANVYTDKVVAGSINIFGNDISTFDSNANINIVPSGTGSLVTSKIAAAVSVDVGTTTPMKLEEIIVGPTTSQVVHYFYNTTTGNSKIADRGDLATYTQVVTNAAETISIGSIDSTRFSADDLSLSIITSTGSQLLRFAYLYAAGVGQVTVLSDTYVGTKPVNTVGLRSGSQTIIDLITNTTATAGEVYKIKIKQTLFSNT